MEKRFGLRLVVAPAAWMVAGIVGLLAAAPAYAHVDPNVPVAGPSLASASSVSPYGQARWAGVASASHSGVTLWPLFAALVGAGLLVAAGWQMWQTVNRRQAAGGGMSLPDAIDDTLDAELRQITEAATETDWLEGALR